MDEAFIIMQIGNADLDAVCDGAIIPAIEAAGLAARRVDRHNEGDLLKSEIVEFIERSQIVVADVTNERPNCYLEIGYAMGLGKKANLILTAREDHHHASPNFRRDGPKIHFDLEGYDILFWDPAHLDAFKAALTQRITRRAAIVSRGVAQAPVPIGAVEWRDELRARGESGLADQGRTGYMEVAAQILPPGGWLQKRLLDAIEGAEVHIFGWPIAITLGNRDEYRPRPVADGVEAEINGSTPGRYDLWKVFRDGRFYTLISLFEDEREEGHIFWDTRIHRVTESLLFLARLYRLLDASDTDQITIQVRHAGLAGRTLRAANSMRMSWDRGTTTEEMIESTILVSLADLETRLADCVKQIIGPLLVVFDLFEISDEVLTQIVDGYVNGEVL